MSSSRSLSGLVARGGNGRGKAVLTINGNTSGLPGSEPYVVVATMTTPDLGSILAGATAVITDLGDLSSHAAITSRELRIPCVVSTKYGTSRINPGDLVTVDADSNRITWTSNPPQCVFCEKHPAVYVLRTQFFFAIYDGYPVREGHLLIIPFRHVQRLTELTREEFLDLFTILTQADHLLRDTYGADSYNLGLNDGPAAGQTVPHLHFHAVPRKNGDVPNPRGGIRNFLPNPMVEYPSE